MSDEQLKHVANLMSQIIDLERENEQLKSQLQQKENIIKEVREYVEEMQIWLVDFEDFGITTKGLLEILDKVEE